MAQITTDSQRELRQQINEQFGNLLEQLSSIPAPIAYRLTTQINEAFDRYASNAELLTENNNKEYQSL